MYMYMVSPWHSTFQHSSALLIDIAIPTTTFANKQIKKFLKQLKVFFMHSQMYRYMYINCMCMFYPIMQQSVY